MVADQNQTAKKEEKKVSFENRFFRIMVFLKKEPKIKEKKFQ